MLASSCKLGVRVGAFVLAGVWSATALAAEPTTAPADSKAYVYVSPGLIHVPFGDDDVEDNVGVGYQWGLGAGGVFELGPASAHTALTVGFSFEHAPIALDDDLERNCEIVFDDCDFSLHNFRLAPEVRFGGGTERLFAYGTVTPGLGILTARSKASRGPFSVEDDDTDVGFDLGFGGGVQYVVWRGLSVGGELGFNFGFYPNDDDDDVDIDGVDDDYGLYTFELKATVGYWF